LQCPGPILKLKQSVDELAEGEALRISASAVNIPLDELRQHLDELLVIESCGLLSVLA